jgi:hypothetical protein
LTVRARRYPAAFGTASPKPFREEGAFAGEGRILTLGRLLNQGHDLLCGGSPAIRAGLAAPAAVDVGDKFTYSID